ncbi:MAG: hypothetical protein K2X07_12955 [Caulobacteraceae bacterium]|nr:hypothetical protein [Caulobacteraceae bacterium]
MKVICIGLCAAVALTACTTAPTSDAQMVQNENDCAVIAAVAKEHYGFGADGPYPVRFSDDYSPACDWGQYGLAFVTPDPVPPRDRENWPGWVSFSRPSYDSQGAVLDTDRVGGVFAGEGVRCRLRSGFAGWTVTDCELVWES